MTRSSPEQSIRLARCDSARRKWAPIRPWRRSFVVITDAFDCFLSSNELNADTAPELFLVAPVPDDVAEALRAGAKRFTNERLAVRSSAVAEDLPDASFAGQYETVLDVRGADAVLDSVRRCWASAFGARVAAYRAQRKQVSASMAVLVQRLVQAEAAGVPFTANPVTGDRSEVVVNAVRGLGERLVSGQVSPDEWLVRGTDATCRHAPEQAITADQAHHIAELARQAAAHFDGVPQDIEWAIANGELFLLQARPITALPDQAQWQVPVEPPPGFWQRSATHCPRPLSPLFRSFFLPLMNTESNPSFRGIRPADRGYGLREIAGWLYVRLVPLGGKEPPPLPPRLASVLLPAMIRLVPAMRTRIRTCVEAIRSDKPGRILARWNDEWRPSLARRVAEFRAADLSLLSDEALDAHIAALLRFTRVSRHPLPAARAVRLHAERARSHLQGAARLG